MALEYGHKPVVSVLMPARNAGRHIDEAIASVVAQTLSDWELIVVDDASQDDTLARAHAWAARDARVRVLTRGRLGLVGALNLAVSEAGGQYLARLDADDRAVPHRLSVQVRWLERRPEWVVVGSSIRLMGDRRGWIPTPMTDWGCRGRLRFENCFAHPSVMMRGSAVQRCLPLYDSEADCVEDLVLWFKLAQVGRLGNVLRPLIFYRVHTAQIAQRAMRRQRQQHARYVVAQWRALGIGVSAQAFRVFRWPDASRVSLGLYACAVWKMLRGAAVLFRDRYAFQACFWFASVMLLNVVRLARSRRTRRPISI